MGQRKPLPCTLNCRHKRRLGALRPSASAPKSLHPATRHHTHVHTPLPTVPLPPLPHAICRARTSTSRRPGSSSTAIRLAPSTSHAPTCPPCPPTSPWGSSRSSEQGRGTGGRRKGGAGGVGWVVHGGWAGVLHQGPTAAWQPAPSPAVVAGHWRPAPCTLLATARSSCHYHAPSQKLAPFLGARYLEHLKAKGIEVYAAYGNTVGGSAGAQHAVHAAHHPHCSSPPAPHQQLNWPPCCVVAD